MPSNCLSSHHLAYSVSYTSPSSDTIQAFASRTLCGTHNTMWPCQMKSKGQSIFKRRAARQVRILKVASCCLLVFFQSLIFKVHIYTVCISGYCTWAAPSAWPWPLHLLCLPHEWFRQSGRRPQAYITYVCIYISSDKVDNTDIVIKDISQQATSPPLPCHIVVW